MYIHTYDIAHLFWLSVYLNPFFLEGVEGGNWAFLPSGQIVMIELF